MYLPNHFAETRPEALHALVAAHPLATLITATAGDGPADDLAIDANPIPLVFSADRGEHGRLRGHVARANPLWRTPGAERPEGVAVLAVFHGPQAYVTPSWYPSKAEHGKVVPTWNYVVVHARGRLRAVDADPAWLRTQLDTITGQQEAPRDRPWQVGDAPADYIERMQAAIVGIEIEVTGWTGKWKVSQNQPDANRDGVIAGLQAQGDSAAAAVAAWVEALRPAR
ncbi:FMN-binding negative transcriptional regulator [Leptothrix sp. BB-4]